MQKQDRNQTRMKIRLFRTAQPRFSLRTLPTVLIVPCTASTRGSEESEDDRNFSLLDPLVCTAHPDDLASVFDPMMDFSFDHFSKERILKLSEDLTRARMQLVH
ncbi:hypothetical protein F2Q69_00035944 [Brassica cretica]|uniref:Uncharacterized protein n=1 Tax=Brassica cretica TaxID=69181 RepID=A0A8S9SC36_BRACR|nr:hypothetical protein F2Q69_00035944 [Brassica cretica]